MRTPTRSSADWTHGPAAWVPILLLIALAAFGAQRSMTTPMLNTNADQITMQVPGFRININTASEAQLQLLPGIGPNLAERIIEDREANGSYLDLQDIQRVRGIGPKTADRIATAADFHSDR